MIFAAIVLMAGFSTTIMAQTSATTTDETTAGAVLIKPMTLTETSPLHFGSITLIGTTEGGTVALSTANVRTISGGGIGTLSSATPLSTNAAYNVTGTYNETYALTLPSTITVTETIAASTGINTMDITALTVLFTSGTPVEKTASGATSVLNASGLDSFKVGGTLTVAAGQIGGIYEGTFPVSVDYN